MTAAGIPKGVSKPKALRHGFGVAGTQSGVPLNIIQRWMGHARLDTTAIYTNAVGDEERALAKRMWKGLP
jgi:site-specific recombinase XerD